MWRRTIEDEIRGIGRSRNEVEIAKPGNSSLMPYAPQGVTGLDDDDDDDDCPQERNDVLTDS